MQPNIVDPRAEKTLYKDQKAWIKRPEKRRSGFVSFLHSCASHFLPAVLQPTGSKGGMAGLLEEADRLKQFAAKSIMVPKLLDVTDNFIILSDCGPHLRHVLKTAEDPQEVKNLLKQATAI